MFNDFIDEVCLQVLCLVTSGQDGGSFAWFFFFSNILRIHYSPFITHLRNERGDVW